MAFLNGLFGGYNEEDFLDEDEKRLRKESTRRSKAAHSNCAADHSDDGDRYSYARQPATHADCKADHSDDNQRRINVGSVNPTAARPQAQQQPRPQAQQPRPQAQQARPNYQQPQQQARPSGTNYQQPRPAQSYPNTTYRSQAGSANNNANKILGGVFAVVLCLSIFISFITAALSKTYNNRSGISPTVTHPQITLDSEMQDILDSMISSAAADQTPSPEQPEDFMTTMLDYNVENNPSRQELYDEFINHTGASETIIDQAINTLSIMNVLDFDQNAYRVAEEAVNSTDSELTEQFIRDTLEPHGFTEENIQYVLSEYGLVEN